MRVPSYKSDHGKHSAQKPVGILDALIGLVTIKGQIILGPFCGSGSTLVAAKKLGRNYTGIEINYEYVNIARERLQDG